MGARRGATRTATGAGNFLHKSSIAGLAQSLRRMGPLGLAKNFTALGALAEGYRAGGVEGSIEAINPMPIGRGLLATAGAARAGNYAGAVEHGLEAVVLAATVALGGGGGSAAGEAGALEAAAEADVGPASSALNAARLAEQLAAEEGPRAYSVAFEAELTPAQYGLSRQRHF